MFYLFLVTSENSQPIMAGTPNRKLAIIKLLAESFEQFRLERRYCSIRKFLHAING